MEWFTTFCGQAADGTPCGWAYVWHIVERSLEHLGLSGTVLLAFTLGMYTLMRRRWLPQMRFIVLVMFSALVALLVLAAREPYDVAAGDSPIKSTIDDYVAWPVSMALVMVGVYVARPIINGAAEDWLTWRARRRRPRR